MPLLYDRATLTASMTSPEKMRTRLLFGSAHPLRVSSNGKQIYAGTPGGKSAEPDQASVEVELNRGGCSRRPARARGAL